MKELEDFHKRGGKVVLDFEPKSKVIYSVKAKVYGYYKRSKRPWKDEVTFPLAVYVKEHEESFIKRMILRAKIRDIYLIECTYRSSNGKTLS